MLPREELNHSPSRATPGPSHISHYIEVNAEFSDCSRFALGGLFTAEETVSKLFITDTQRGRKCLAQYLLGAVTAGTAGTTKQHDTTSPKPLS